MIVYSTLFFLLFKYPSLLLLIQSRFSNAVQSVLIDSIQKMIRCRIVTAQQRMKIWFACFLFFVLRGKTAITTTTTTIIASMTTNQSDVFAVFHEAGSLCVCVCVCDYTVDSHRKNNVGLDNNINICISWMWKKTYQALDKSREVVSEWVRRKEKKRK